MGFNGGLMGFKWTVCCPVLVAVLETTSAHIMSKIDSTNNLNSKTQTFTKVSFMLSHLRVYSNPQKMLKWMFVRSYLLHLSRFPCHFSISFDIHLHPHNPDPHDIPISSLW